MYDLIIVESPAKAKTISNFLGKGYEVIASKGHIRDLPSYKTGVKIDQEDVLPEYEIKQDHKSIAKDIISLSKKANRIFIATDEDREGEAIGWHLTHILGKPYDEFPRIVFHEITKRAIKHALENPRKIDMNKVEAQQARRILDRVVGFNLSSLLQSKIQKGLSAGRVQSCVLNLILEREEAVKKFTTTKYWSFEYYGEFGFEQGHNEELETEFGEGCYESPDDRVYYGYKEGLVGLIVGLPLTHYDPNGNVSLKDTIQDKENKNITRFQDEKEAEKLFAEINKWKDDFIILESGYQDEKSIDPKPPFMTSTLQRYMSSTYGYSPTKTMQLAQKLYEGVDTPEGKQGAITYMRTDSLNIAKEAQDSAREFILNNFGKMFVPETPKNYATGAKGAQEAHEAIRPTNVNFTPEIAKKYLEPDELKLYTAVYDRFLASQSVPLRYAPFLLRVGDRHFIFSKIIEELVFDGYMRVAPSLKNKMEHGIIPRMRLHEDEYPIFKELKMIAKETQPPPRYSEAGLVKVMEKEGIGRPSTYAATVSLLIKRGYVKLENKQLVPTENAYKAIDGLSKYFSYLLDKKYTARLEEELDEISNSQKEWKRLLIDFYLNFKDIFDKAKEEIPSQKVSIPTGEDCPHCQSPMVIRKGKYGEFECCSAYPKCKYIKPKEPKDVVFSDFVCPGCNHQLEIRQGMYGEYYACDTCKIKSKYRPVKDKCNKCQSFKVLKSSYGKDSIFCLKCDVKPKKGKKKSKR